MGILGFLLGRRLANREFQERKIGAFEGLPSMGLDGLGSSAYGPEAALTILAPLGAASLTYIGWAMASVVALLSILFVSYWQTIRAYPNNGGAFPPSVRTRETKVVSAPSSYPPPSYPPRRLPAVSAVEAWRHASYCHQHPLVSG